MPRTPTLDWVFKTLSLVALVVLAGIAGAWWAWRDGAGFRETLKRPFIALEARIHQGDLVEDSVFTHGWTNPDPSRPTGLQTVSPERVAPGVTLATYGQFARLIDADGETLHAWDYDLRQHIGEPGAVIGEGASDLRLFWRPARVDAQGNLTVIVAELHASPFGLALLQIDRASRLNWVVHGHYHHDFDIADDGRLYVLDLVVRETPPDNLTEMEGPLFDEGVAIVSADGQYIARLSLVDALAASPYAELVRRKLRVNRVPWGDYLHSNNLDVLERPAAVPRAWGDLENGLLLSFREIDTLALFDLDRMAITWADTGNWHLQHDPDLLPDGRLLIYDNLGFWARGGLTRVVRFDVDTHAIDWQFPEAGSRWTLASASGGDQQPLANGNVLINDYWGGRLLEVDPGGEVVWEYICPFTHPRVPGPICRFQFAERYPADALGFLQAGDERSDFD